MPFRRAVKLDCAPFREFFHLMPKVIFFIPGAREPTANPCCAKKSELSIYLEKQQTSRNEEKAVPGMSQANRLAWSREAIRGMKLGISTSLVILAIGIIIVASVGIVILATSTSVQTESLFSTQTTVRSTAVPVTSIQTQTSNSATTASTASTFTSIKSTSSSQSGPKVSIENFTFSPSTITVVIGVNNTVTWTNYDVAAHTVTAIDGAFDSGNLNTNQSWTHTFTTPGTYEYECSYHIWMTGTIIVESG